MTRNSAVVPSARLTKTSLPAFSSDSRKNTPRLVTESTWPTMMAEPTEPGRGLPVYQPATVVEDGTCIAPPAARPSVIRLVFTPISGMVSETGLATGAGSADCGGATMGPVGAGSAATPAATGRRAGVE